MKKLLSILTVLLVMLCMAVPVFADGELIVDGADLLTEAEEQAINTQLQSIRDEYGIDVAVLTTDSTNGLSIMTYADNYYDSHGYAPDGVMLVLNMDTENGGENRGWWITTTGKGISAFTDYGIEEIGTDIKPLLSNGQYGLAFAKYADLSRDFISQYIETGTAYDTNNEYGVVPVERKVPWTRMVIVALIAGVVIGAIAASSQKAKHKTVRNQLDAAAYTDKSSVALTGHSDTYLYRNVTAVPIPQNDGPRGGGGGGSSVHVSSGGVSHGGGGGSF